jgi:hypothetical protein
LGYSAIYHSYENFVRECMAILEGKEDYKIDSLKALKRDFTHHFGEPLFAECVTHQRVDTARLIRNALAHNGGRETAQLPSDHGIRIESGVLQIMASDVKALMELLQNRAHRLAAKGVTLPVAQPTKPT